MALVQETDQEPVIDLSGGIGAGAPPLGGVDQSKINTEIEVLRSRGLVEKLVDELDLLNDPEFNAELREPSVISVSNGIDFGTRLLGLPQREVIPMTEQAIRDEVVNKVREVLLVGNVRQSYVYNVTVTTTDAIKSALMANTLAELYISNQLDVKNEANLNATSWLADRVADLRIELENAEKNRALLLPR